MTEEVKDATNVDYIALLEEELKSCCKPQVKDLSHASTEDIVRDLHRVLTGNGDATHGLIFKVAATNVNVKLIKNELTAVGAQAAAQTKRCSEFRSKLKVNGMVAEAERTTIRRIGKTLWENRAMILLFLFAAVMYFNNIIGANEASAAVEQRIDKLIDKKIGQLIGGPLVSVSSSKK